MPRSSDSHDLGHAERTPCPTQVLHLQVDNVTLQQVETDFNIEVYRSHQITETEACLCGCRSKKLIEASHAQTRKHGNGQHHLRNKHNPLDKKRYCTGKFSRSKHQIYHRLGCRHAKWLNPHPECRHMTCYIMLYHAIIYYDICQHALQRCWVSSTEKH